MRDVEIFLKRRWDGASPLLLGCSGGIDSKALLYALFEAGVGPLLHVAHVDHGWREESAREAIELQEEVERLGFSFHSTRLEPAAKNREAEAREGRMEFFLSLFRQAPFQALLLAHQAEDLAETVLKRVLEGAHLPFVEGMRQVSDYEGVAIWRPFLGVRRAEILAFLEKRKLCPFLDPTNSDPAYLRSRMREEIFPFLNRSFGKETVGNLICLAERASELRDYLEKKVALISIEERDGEKIICLQNIERLEARYLLQKHCDLARPLLETLLDWIEEKKIKRLTPKVFADRGIVFIRP